MIKVYKNGDFIKTFNKVDKAMSFIKKEEGIVGEALIKAAFNTYLNMVAIRINKNEYAIHY